MIKRTSACLNVFNMTRRAPSTSPPRNAKRAKIEHLTLNDFKDGVFLAPMVRSGAPWNVRLTTVSNATTCELETAQNAQQKGQGIVGCSHGNCSSRRDAGFLGLRKLTLLWVMWRTLTRKVFEAYFSNIKVLGGCRGVP
ncbi:uncharacterized protein BT62DRAFT_573231 [Guyanagaster necrorhizus]|uniref:Uncharacterized protein n=1 Tax=Guyanagaster necrorhizus TaxID=856835 RepID=A0A9P8AND6_9AGAR|nr:uncharacterized protein BT62DRAFT_573231 [Guyanagaster necrorhizus MCA 3950]KAG7440782.1 hypothetical protein BT62DRAFT_573231 [Guyanagaster necrorhizus MCA 3950]